MGLFGDNGFNPIPSVVNTVSSAVQSAGGAISTVVDQTHDAGSKIIQQSGGNSGLFASVNPYNAVLTQSGRQEAFRIYEPVVRPVAQVVAPGLLEQVQGYLQQLGLGDFVNNLFGVTNNDGGTSNAYSQGEGGTYISSSNAKSSIVPIIAIAAVAAGAIYFLKK